MSKWSQAYKNRLKDEAFLYIERGGKIDATGRTVPRSLRHLPVYDLQGRLSLSHVRSVLGSYGERVQIPAAARAEARAVARQLLDGAKAPSSRRVKIIQIPKIKLGAHTCLHCKKKIKGHPVTYWRTNAPARHYHEHHAHHEAHRKAA